MSRVASHAGIDSAALLAHAARGIVSAECLDELFAYHVHQSGIRLTARLSDSLYQRRAQTNRKEEMLTMDGWLRFVRSCPDLIQGPFTLNAARMAYANCVGYGSETLSFDHFMDVLVETAKLRYRELSAEDAVRRFLERHVAPVCFELFGEEAAASATGGSVSLRGGGGVNGGDTTSVVSGVSGRSQSKQLVQTTHGVMSRQQALERGIAVVGTARRRKTMSMARDQFAEAFRAAEDTSLPPPEDLEDDEKRADGGKFPSAVYSEDEDEEDEDDRTGIAETKRSPPPPPSRSTDVGSPGAMLRSAIDSGELPSNHPVVLALGGTISRLVQAVSALRQENDELRARAEKAERQLAAMRS